MSVIGFDFGYQSCYIAVARQGGIETIANEYSDRVTPVFVSFGEKNRTFGTSAKNQLISNMKNTTWGWKKLIGRKYQDPAVQKEKSLFPYELVEGPNGSTGIRVQYLQETQVFSPEQLTAMILVKLRDTASTALKIKVVDCVLSCPCYFTDAERHAMLDAAQMAGLNVLRLMNDTTATALAYGIYKQDLPAPEEKSRNVIFVDIGHSDLQCAAVAFNKGKLKVLATAADANLGGRDLDLMIANHFAAEFKTRYKVDAKTKPKAFVRLLQECEKLKKLMSANATEIPLNLECFMEDKDVTGKMKREMYESIGSGFFQHVEEVMKACLDNSKLSLDDVYSVEVIGGATRTPAIKQLVTKVFGKDASTTINSDEAVARGCALQCAILSPVFRVRDFTILDAQPYSITLSWTAGIEDESEMEVFSKCHQIPFSKMLTFYRKEPFTVDARYTLPVDVPHTTTELGQFNIDSVIPQASGESSKVKVKVRVNIHGVFTVSSASMVEKVESKEEEPMETEEVNGKQTETKEGEAQAETPAPEQGNEGMDTSAGDAQPEEQAKADAKAEEAEQKDDKKENKEGDEKKDAKKKQKVKTVDLPVSSSVSGLSKEELNLLFEKEGQMQASDKLESERSDAKNAVEEYVYEMRDKLYSTLENYVKEADKETLSALLTSTEDWIYDEGEDQQKQVYIDKLQELKKLGQPIMVRCNESQTRNKAFEELAKAIVQIRKAVELYQAGDEKYNHLEKAEMEKVEKWLKEKVDFYEKNVQLCSILKPYDDPPVLTSTIQSNKTFLESTCGPVINKPKPKPKEDPPKDEPKKEEAKDSKAAEGQEATTEGQSGPQQGNEQSQSSEGDKADMDLD